MSIKVIKQGTEYTIGGCVASGDTLPIGTVVDFTGQTIPQGWEVYEGQTIDDLIKQIQQLTPHSYTYIINEDLQPEVNITIPCYYKVGSEVLDVYLNGSKLILSTDGTPNTGHYIEVGTKGNNSNIIKTTSDWNFLEGDVLQLIVRGTYS